MKNPPPTFDEFVQFVRRQTGDTKTPVTYNTSFDNELGVTGDDGVDLLIATEKEYGISLEPIGEMLQMKANEQLFHDEGFGLIDFQELMRWLKNKPQYIVRDLRVGELYDVVCQLVASRSGTSRRTLTSGNSCFVVCQLVASRSGTA